MYIYMYICICVYVYMCISVSLHVNLQSQRKACDREKTQDDEHRRWIMPFPSIESSLGSKYASEQTKQPVST